MTVRDTTGSDSADHDEASPPGSSWHFKLMVALAAVYLGWRLVQLLVWVFT